MTPEEAARLDELEPSSNADGARNDTESKPIGGVIEPEPPRLADVLGDAKSLVEPAKPPVDESTPGKIVDLMNAVRPPGVTIVLSPLALRVLEEMQRLGFWGKNLDEIVTHLALSAIRSEMVNFPILMPQVRPQEKPRVQPVGGPLPSRPSGKR